jgi:hypothetical protein
LNPAAGATPADTEGYPDARHGKQRVGICFEREHFIVAKEAPPDGDPFHLAAE